MRRIKIVIVGMLAGIILTVSASAALACRGETLYVPKGCTSPDRFTYNACYVVDRVDG